MNLALSKNPINLALRFILELCAFYSIGYWGWNSSEGGFKYLLAFGTPLLAAFLWGRFRTKEDFISGKKAPTPIPGTLRLVIELIIFGFAVWGLFSSGVVTIAWVFLIVTLLHYIISYDYILWLFKN